MFRTPEMVEMQTRWQAAALEYLRGPTDERLAACRHVGKCLLIGQQIGPLEEVLDTLCDDLRSKAEVFALVTQMLATGPVPPLLPDRPLEDQRAAAVVQRQQRHLREKDAKIEAMEERFTEIGCLFFEAAKELHANPEADSDVGRDTMAKLAVLLGYEDYEDWIQHSNEDE